MIELVFMGVGIIGWVLLMWHIGKTQKEDGWL